MNQHRLTVQLQLAVASQQTSTFNLVHSDHRGYKIEAVIKVEMHSVLATAELKSDSKVPIPLILIVLFGLMEKASHQENQPQLRFQEFSKMIKSSIVHKSNRDFLVPPAECPHLIDLNKELLEKVGSIGDVFTFEKGIVIVFFINEQLKALSPSTELDKLEKLGNDCLNNLKDLRNKLILASTTVNLNYLRDEMIWISRFVLWPSHLRMVDIASKMMAESIAEGDESEGAIDGVCTKLKEVIDDAGYIFVENALIDIFSSNKSETILEIIGWPRSLEVIPPEIKTKVIIFLRILGKLSEKSGQSPVAVYLKVSNYPGYGSYHCKTFFYHLQCRQLEDCLLAAIKFKVKPSEKREIQTVELTNPTFSVIGGYQRFSIMRRLDYTD